MDRRAGLGWLQSWPAIALLLMTLLGIYQRTDPLQNRRPIVDRDSTKATPPVVSATVDLKLWQDPLDAPLNPTTAATGAVSSRDTIDEQFKSIAEKLRPILTPSAIAPLPTIPNNDARHLSEAHHATAQIFFIPVDEERTAEGREVRLRRRQAVLAALRASGLVAESNSQVNRLLVDSWYPYPSATKNPESSPNPLSNFLTYEWFKTDPLLPDTKRPTATRQALVVWIPSRAFGEEILQGLNGFLDNLCCRSNTSPQTLEQQLELNRLRITLLGPESSSSLDGILRWTYRNYVQKPTTASKYQPTDSWLRFIHVVSPASTYDTALTLEELWREHANSEAFQAHGEPRDLENMLQDEHSLLRVAHVDFQRTIGRDSALAGRLIRELELRGVNLIPKIIEDESGARSFDLREYSSLDDVAIVSESNSLYGRSFPVIFAAAMLSYGNVEQDSQIHQQVLRFLKDGVVPKNLRNYSYIRQVDGSRSVDPPMSKQTAADRNNLNVAGTSSYPEAPLGDGQLDSIRRLALQLADEYRDGNVGGKRLKAIGVIGSDVYDKLLILQALRQVFPNVIFFTTDLDARLYQTENLPWTRNLLVASHFGLSLNKHYQRGLLDAEYPAFRDSYQTSYFFALRYQLGLPIANHGANEGKFWEKDELRTLITQSRIFEIGRERAIDLTGTVQGVSEARRLHPPRHRHTFAEVVYKLMVYAVALACLAALCLYTLVDFDQIVLIKLDPSTRRRSLTPQAWWILIAVLVAGSFTALIIFDNYRPSGEIWSINSGTSVWPCLVLRLIACFLVALFTWQILRQHRPRSLTSFMARELQIRVSKLNNARGHRITYGPPLKILLGAYLRLPMERLRGLFVLGPPPRAHHTQIGNDDESTTMPETTEVSVQRCWRRYQRDTHPLLMSIRALAMATIMGIAYYALATFADEPHPSYRGALNRFVYQLVTYGSDTAVAFLAFMVVDSTLNVCQLVKRITHGKSSWPRSIQDQCALPAGSQSAIVEVLDVRFVASITEQVGRQVYYPFFALMFIIIARLGLFDAPSWTPPLIITYSLIFLSVPACIFILRRAAARGRDDSARALRTAIERSRSEKETTDSLSALLKEIEETKRGAFSPLLDDPFFGALLLPSGGFTAVGLIERWLG